MNPLDLAIRLSAQGGNQATGEVSRVGVAVHHTGEQMDSATREANELATAYDRVANSTGKVRGGDGEFLKQGADDAKQFANGLDSAANSADVLGGKLEKVRNTGLAMSAIGAGGLALSSKLIEVSEEGRAVSQRLESILNQQGRLQDMSAIDSAVQDVTVRGHFDDDDQIRDSAVKLASFSVQTKHMGELMEDSARQARTMGTDISQVAEQLGKAYDTGNVSMLKKSGVTIDQADIDRIKEAYAVSKELGQAEFMKTIGSAIKRNTVALEDSLTATQAAANDAARALDDAMTNMGTGAAEAKQQMQGLVAQLLVAANANPELEKTMGYILGWGSAGLTATGGVVTLIGQVGLASAGLKAMGFSGNLSFAAMKAGALSTAGAMLPLLAYALLIGIIIAGFAVAFYGARDAGTMAADDLIDKWGLLGEVWDDLAKKLDTIVNHPAFRILNPIGYAAAAAAGLTHNDSKGSKDELESLRQRNEDRKKQGLRELSLQEFRDGLDPEKNPGGMKDGLRKKGQAKSQEELALEAKGKASTSSAQKLSGADLSGLGSQFKSALADLDLPSVESGGDASGFSSPSASDMPAFALPSGNSGAASSAATDAEVSQLQDAIILETDKDKKKQLQIALRHAKERQKQAKADTKQSKEMSELDEKLSAAKSDANSEIHAAEIEAAQKQADEADERALKARLKKIEADKESGLLDADAAEEQTEHARDYYEGLKKRREAHRNLQKAELDAQEAIAQANIEAANQTGKEKETTLALAKIKADKIRAVARIENSDALSKPLGSLDNSAHDLQSLLPALATKKDATGYSAQDRIGFSRQSINSLSQKDARRLVNVAGSESERESYQRAYDERFGGSGGLSSNAGALLNHVRNGGSLYDVRGKKPNAGDAATRRQIGDLGARGGEAQANGRAEQGSDGRWRVKFDDLLLPTGDTGAMSL